LPALAPAIGTTTATVEIEARLDWDSKTLQSAVRLLRPNGEEPQSDERLSAELERMVRELR
jgi:hypothetical protein